MERRKFLLGAGSAAVGASALVGSGAFSSVNANRDFDVKVANDENAYLRLSKSSTYAYEDSSGSLKLDFADQGNGSGINGRADTRFDDVFTIENQGTQTVYVWVAGARPTSGKGESTEFIATETGRIPNDDDDFDGKSPVDITFPPSEAKDNVTPKRSTDTTTQGGYVKLGSGDSVSIDIKFFVNGGANESYRPGDDVYNDEIQFRANTAPPSDKDDYTDDTLSDE